jgi:hypothetical protein
VLVVMRLVMLVLMLLVVIARPGQRRVNGHRELGLV